MSAYYIRGSIPLRNQNRGRQHYKINNLTTNKMDKLKPRLDGRDNKYDEYVFVNFGEKVSVIDNAGLLCHGVVTEFDPSVPESNTKIVYEEGGFDWYNRDEVESWMRELEIIKSKTENEQTNL